ncbi:carbohydrate ABC transporter permease [Paenibacillus sp. ACRRY]|uniref:carbohydrate ABC transporter permease n=1 Tax=Paenibacillus sp. ACRRY TaxID=2918208 RepID=UPI001EF46527|nr:carbohydrate ABC transporter permease [Paenibacillus sp. ACRRY]MCG7384669.1 carbohydrate ABC transporter permease [Paenibacillus sp. ACRRY]
MKAKENSISILKYLFLIFHFGISIYPLIWMGLNSFKDNEEIFSTNPFGLPQQWRVENYFKALTELNLHVYFKNSLIIGLFAVIFTVLLSLMFSYATARMTWKGSSLMQTYMSLGMFIPIQIVIIPLVILVQDLHIQQTYTSIILPYIAFQLSFTSMVFFGFLKGIPKEVEEAAAIDGAGLFRTFFQIIVPLVKPSIATMSIFIILNNWNEFFVSNILISDDKIRTLPLAVMFLQGRFDQDWGTTAAVLTLSSLPVIILYLIFSEQVENAMTVGSAVKG